MSKPVIAVVDAFAPEAFQGNPAGVLLLEEWPEDHWLQQFAAEMRHSETAFLVPLGEAQYHLRWFTPTTEMKLCGHATLASAHLLWELGIVRPDQTLRFASLSGELRVRRDGDLSVLDFPVWNYQPSVLSEKASVALGVKPQNVVATPSDEERLIIVGSAAEVRALKPDFATLRSLPEHMFIVSAKDDSGRYDIVSRVFPTGLGIDEDPVTGSAHTLLAAYWSEVLGKTTLSAWQASERGGELSLRLEGDRVHIGGRSATLFVGELVL